MSRGSLGNRLYNGEVSFDFIGRQKLWYAISAAILLVSVGGVVFRGLDLGIDFRGGAEFQLESTSADVDRALDALADADIPGEPRAQTLGQDVLRVQTEELTTEQTSSARAALAEAFEVSTEEVSSSFIGPSWGEDISRKALRALIVFLIIITIYLSIAFEWKMAISALVALLHDIIITIGIYALVGFEVTPATVIGLLTILGFSLYDTVVVFDKVRENTAGITAGSRMSYSSAANLAVNQTIVRSLNTSIIALLPIAAILFVGAGLLGAGTLKDLALVLLIGTAVGAYSSIFIATPLLADLKEREPAMQGLAKRVEARAASRGTPAPAKAATTPAARRRARGGATAVVLDKGTSTDPVASPAGPAAGRRAASGGGARAAVDAEDASAFGDGDAGDAGDEGPSGASPPAAAPQPRTTPAGKPGTPRGSTPRNQPRRQTGKRPGGPKKKR